MYTVMTKTGTRDYYRRPGYHHRLHVLIALALIRTPGIVGLLDTFGYAVFFQWDCEGITDVSAQPSCHIDLQESTVILSGNMI